MSVNVNRLSSARSSPPCARSQWAFLRFYRLPPKYGAALSRYATDALPWAVLGHTLFAAWAFSVPEIFPVEASAATVGVAPTVVAPPTTAGASAGVAGADALGAAGSGYTMKVRLHFLFLKSLTRLVQNKVNGFNITVAPNANSADYWAPPVPSAMTIRSCLARLLLSPNTLPQALLLLAWTLWFVLTKVHTCPFSFFAQHSVNLNVHLFERELRFFAFRM